MIKMQDKFASTFDDKTCMRRSCMWAKHLIIEIAMIHYLFYLLLYSTVSSNSNTPEVVTPEEVSRSKLGVLLLSHPRLDYKVHHAKWCFAISAIQCHSKFLNIISNVFA